MKTLINISPKILTGLILMALLFSGTKAFTQGSSPKLPRSLTIAAKSTTYMIITWIDSDLKTSVNFIIERSADGGNSFSAVGTLGSQPSQVNPQYTDPNLAPGTQYCYRVKGKNTFGESGYSNVVCATTDAIPVPQGLNATATGTNSVQITWTRYGGKDSGETIIIERSTGSGGSFSQVGTSTADFTTFTDTSVSPSTEYCYRIKARTGGRDSGYSNVACATTRQTAPAAPSALIAQSLDPTFQIQLNWIDGSNNETGFEIERSTDNVNFVKIATTAANVTQYVNSGLAAEIRYYYKVRAINTVGSSGYTNVADAITNPNPPAGPGNLTATTVSESQINLNWTDHSNNETGFEVERSQDGTNFSKIADATTNATSYASSGLSPNTQYWYRIRAKNNGGMSDYSNTANATTKDVAPAAPQNLSATPVSNVQINLNWTDKTANETGFEIERSADGNHFSKIADLSANVTAYESTGLSTLTKYWYRVRAKNAIGYSPYSNIVETTTFDVPPIAPTDLTATVISSSQIDLSWKDNAANETVFEIERSTDGINFGKIAEVGANVTTYQSTGLLPATRYWYRVRAKNSVNPSTYSNAADATTRDVVPNTPETLSATAVSFQEIALTWTDKSENEAGFDIERSTDGTNFSKIAGVSANVSTYQSAGLDQLTQYFFRVKAVNAIGSSNYSNIANATTQKAPIPDKPKNLTAIPVDFDLVQLTWDPVSTNATDVVIERSRKQDADFVEIGKQAASLTRFADREILEVQDYYYRIKAVNAAGGSSYSDLANVKGSSIITGAELIQKGNLVYAYNKVLHIERMKPGRASVKIFTMNGTKIKEFEIPQTSQTDLQQLTPGIYFLVLEEKNQVTKQKIVILSSQN